MSKIKRCAHGYGCQKGLPIAVNEKCKPQSCVQIEKQSANEPARARQPKRRRARGIKSGQKTAARSGQRHADNLHRQQRRRGHAVGIEKGIQEFRRASRKRAAPQTQKKSRQKNRERHRFDVGELDERQSAGNGKGDEERG